jgi:hypothetical protein
MKLKKTITSIFIVPTLSISREKLTDNGFVNGYIKDGKRDVQYENAVYLLFKPDNLDKFGSFLDEEHERSKQVIDDYDYEKGYVVIVYELNPRLKDDIELIKKLEIYEIRTLCLIDNYSNLSNNKSNPCGNNTTSDSFLR